MLSFFQSLWLHSLSRPSHEFDENKQLDHESTINFPFIDRLFLTAPGLNAFLVLPQHTARPFITIHKPIHRVVYCFSRHYLYIVKDIWEYQGTVENTRLRARVAGFHLHIYHMSRIPFLFLSFVDFVVFVSMILIFPSNQMKCAISSTNVAILLLLFKRTITWPNPLQIRHRRKIVNSIHPRISPSQPRGYIHHSKKLPDKDSNTGRINFIQKLIPNKRARTTQHMSFHS